MAPWCAELAWPPAIMVLREEQVVMDNCEGMAAVSRDRFAAVTLWSDLLCYHVNFGTGKLVVILLSYMC